MQRAIEVAGTGFAVLDRIYTGSREPVEALGGSCGNVLISLAMLKRAVAPLLVLGTDRVGQALVDEFEQAGADTQYILCRDDVESPILAQYIDTSSGQHSFSFICPETDRPLPRYKPIESAQVHSAHHVLKGCEVFYTDRLTAAIVEAMEEAVAGGAIVYFEPSEIADEVLFEQALELASIVKFSSDRLSDEMRAYRLRDDAITIVTHGSLGLEVHQAANSTWCSAIQAPFVRDTCGSGDMVTVGVIDWLLEHGSESAWTLENLVPGVVAGQTLAAANCAFPGARGLFSSRGADFARMVLQPGQCDLLSQLELFA
jgi:fructokinase